MARVIRCVRCEKKLGEIRNATLSKNISYSCEFCTAIMLQPAVNKASFNEIFGSLKR